VSLYVARESRGPPEYAVALSPGADSLARWTAWNEKRLNGRWLCNSNT
jgi:hypothetical protein